MESLTACGAPGGSEVGNEAEERQWVGGFLLQLSAGLRGLGSLEEVASCLIVQDFIVSQEYLP